MLSSAPPRRRVRDAARPLVSLRSPLPLLIAGLGVTLLVIVLTMLPPRPAVPDASQTAQLSEQEVRSLVAHEMRSGAAAAKVLSTSNVRFDDGVWYVSVGDAEFYFSQRNRIVVANNPAAIQF